MVETNSPSSTDQYPPAFERLKILLANNRDTVHGYLFLAPFLTVYLIFLVYPVIRGLHISLHDWDLLVGQLEYIGLDNYTRMFNNDDTFRTATMNTLEFVALSTPPLIILGLLLAIALNRPLPAMGLFRTIFFSSYVLSISVVTLIWFMLLNPTRGILAEFLGTFGVEPIAWLNEPSLAMPAIVITTVWWTLGFNIVIFLAGLQDIPASIYEAARLDGAGSIRLFFSMTVPLLRRTIMLVAILQVIASFQVFGQVFLMTKGGPSGTTRVLVQHIYERGFRGFELGYASAMSMFLFAIMLGISIFQMVIGSRGDELESGSK